MEESSGGELKIALGPVGVAGLVAALLGLLRRSPLLFALGGGAVLADALVPSLGGFAAMRMRHAGMTPQGDESPLRSR